MKMKPLKFYPNVDNILKEASFNIRKWQTKNAELQELWNSLENLPIILKIPSKFWDSSAYSGRDVIKIDPKRLSSKSHLKT